MRITPVLAPRQHSSEPTKRRTRTQFVIVLVSLLIASAEAGKADCRQDKLENVVRQNQVDLGLSMAKVAANGILVIAARGSKPVVIATALLLASELPGLVKAVSDAQQLFGQATNAPNQLVEICDAPDSLARAFHVQHLSLVGPQGATEQITVDSSSLKATGPEPPPFSLRPRSPNLKSYLDQIQDLERQPQPLIPALTPTPKSALPKPMPPQALLPKLQTNWWSQQPGVITGSVYDADSRYPLTHGVVHLTNVSGAAQGIWRTIPVDDRVFVVSVPAGDYILSAYVDGYTTYSRQISVTSSSKQDLNIALSRQNPYPCDYTVINNTGWEITLEFDDGGPPFLLHPWSNYAFTMRRDVRIAPRAYFTDGSPLFWYEIHANCLGARYANLRW